MKKTTYSLISLVAMTLASVSPAGKSPLDAFPSAKEGWVRYVLTLEEKDRTEEGDFKIEVVAGKVMETDGVNQIRLNFSLTEKPLKGWGYTFYEVAGNGVAMSTEMAPPPGVEPVTRFVSGTPLLIRYNSRLPVVIYAPIGIEVRSRVWSAASVFTVIPTTP